MILALKLVVNIFLLPHFLMLRLLGLCLSTVAMFSKLRFGLG